MTTTAAGGHDLTGRVALVTAGGNGIGAATAVLLAQAGATVVVSDLSHDDAASTAAAIEADGFSAISRALDVTDRDAFFALVGEVKAAHGSLDILVNNAGYSHPQPILDVSPDDLRRAMDVNVFSVLHGTQAAAGVMEAGGSVINTLSAVIDNVGPLHGAYAAAKYGAWALTHSFARELGPLGIRVNGVAPGFTPTTMSQASSTTDGTFDPESFEKLKEKIAAKTPLPGHAVTEDQAQAFLFLASPAARFVSGQVIRVNGGATMR